MKKKTAARIVLGFPVGIAIGNVITVVISLIWGGGNYFVCVPEFKELDRKRVGRCRAAGPAMRNNGHRLFGGFPYMGER